jgi:penicillin-binding protein 2
MTIAQAGTGSGASGEAVRNIYSALYGVQADGSIDNKKALLPTPQKGLPKVRTDGTIAAPQVAGDPAKDAEASQKNNPSNGGDQPAATASPTTGNRNTRRRPRRNRRRGSRRMPS